jgi:hypothetical protein
VDPQNGGHDAHFNLLQNFQSAVVAKIQYYVFDIILALKGRNVSQLPLWSGPQMTTDSECSQSGLRPTTYGAALDARKGFPHKPWHTITVKRAYIDVNQLKRPTRTAVRSGYI